MSYVDAYFDRDADIIPVVERNDGKRLYTEYLKVYSIMMIPRGKHRSIYGDPIQEL